MKGIIETIKKVFNYMSGRVEMYNNRDNNIGFIKDDDLKELDKKIQAEIDKKREEKIV